MARPRKSRTGKSNVVPKIGTEPEMVIADRPEGTRGLKSLVKFAIDGVADHLKSIIGAAVVGGFIALVLYFWQGDAAWLYQYIRYFAIFIAGSLTLLVPLLIASVRRRRQQQKAARRAKTGRFVSDKKGLLDYVQDFEKAQKRFPKIWNKIAGEMKRIGSASSNPRFAFWARFSATWANNSASKLAERFFISASNIEEGRLETVEVLKLMNDSVSHQIRYGLFDDGRLLAMLTALQGLITTSRNARANLKTFRLAQDDVVGVSMDMNTSMNYLKSVTEGLMNAMENAEKEWEKHVYLLENRIGNRPVRELR